MQVRLLGPVEVVVDGAPSAVPGLRRKTVLAVLAAHGGEVVDAGRLVDFVWGEDAPRTAAATVQGHISYLRRVLGDGAAIVARPPGYVLDIEAEAVDVQVAERLVREGMQAVDREHRAGRLEAALALWRGRPLADLAGVLWADEQARRLDQVWLQATRALIETRLALGDHALVVSELERLVRDHPLDEQLHAHLMLALYRAGRQGDALAVYQQVRDTLHGDLGVDPQPALRELHRSILRQDPALDLPGPGSGTATVPVPVPAQLPPAVATFTGRRRELAHLDALLPPAGDADPARPVAVVVSAVSGTAGAGKTALAVHWAHRAAARFPDGQLYVNLRGFDPTGSPLDPATALRRFLAALDVPAEQIPADLDAQLALYRSRLSGKRVLVVLDNARDSAQVRPLLPGAPTCLVLVTSRRQLTGLVADGAAAVNIDVLAFNEAHDLLARRLGADRIAAEPEAVKEIIACCARLPLALVVLAAHATTRPDTPLSTLIAELRESQDRLGLLTTDDPVGDVRAVFSWSYRLLSPAAARLFRLLGLHPGPDISAPAAASLTALPLPTVRPLLTELVQANLIAEDRSGRYTSHDLLRAYAAELTHRVDTDAQRRAATGRMLDHYLHTTYAADRLLPPVRDRLPGAHTAARDGVSPEHFADHTQAMDWLVAEHSVLLAAVDHSAATGFDRHAWQLAWALATYLYRRGHWHDQAAITNAALAAARRLDDPAAQAFAHRILAKVHTALCQFDDAHTHLRDALEQSRRHGDLLGQGLALEYAADVLQRQRSYPAAMERSRQALGLYRAAGARGRQGAPLNGIGLCHTRLGNHRQAIVYGSLALALHQETGDRPEEAATWATLGHAHLGLGDVARSATCYQHAIEIFQAAGDLYREAFVLASLGDTHHAAGATDAAEDAWKQALIMLDDLGHPDADRVRTKLAGDHDSVARSSA